MGTLPGVVIPRFGRRPTATESLERVRSWRRLYLRLRVTFFLTLLAIIAIAVFTPSVEDRRAAAAARSEWEHSGVLDENDLGFEDGSGVYDEWTLSLEQADTLRVQLRSEGMTPRFVVEGPLYTADPPEALALSELNQEDGIARTEMVAAQGAAYAVLVYAESGDPLGAYRLTSNRPLGDSLNAIADLMFSDDPPRTRAETWGIVLVGLLLLQLTALPAVLFWRHPDRILLLRPFGEQAISRALKKFNRGSLAHRGFTFTLADKHLKDSFGAYVLAHIPFDLGGLATVLYRPVFRRLHRYMLIRKTGDLRLILLRLRSRWRLTAFWQSWVGLSDRINKFRSRDAHWQDCIGLLMDNCQVFVVDITRAGQGTSWEMEEIVRRGYQYKAIFLVLDQASEIAAASHLLNRIFGATPPVLHRYAEDSGVLRDQNAFDLAYAAAVADGRQPQPAALPISGKAAAAPIPVVGVALGILGLQDIRRANGMLRGELVAHGAIMTQVATAAVLVVLWWMLSAASRSIASEIDAFVAADTFAAPGTLPPADTVAVVDSGFEAGEPLAPAIVDAGYAGYCEGERSTVSQQNTDSVSIRFTNLGRDTVQIFWLDWNGERILYQTLPPDTEYDQPTYRNHYWVVVRQDGACLALLKGGTDSVFE